MIDDIDLHDATLVAIHLTWAEGTCVLTLRHGQLSNCTLTFTGVSDLVLPRAQPWGPSHSIDSVSQRVNGKYEIEMQSGDLFTIDANDVVFVSDVPVWF